jgi:hypothetical protein
LQSTGTKISDGLWFNGEKKLQSAISHDVVETLKQEMRYKLKFDDYRVALLEKHKCPAGCAVQNDP